MYSPLIDAHVPRLPKGEQKKENALFTAAKKRALFPFGFAKGRAEGLPYYRISSEEKGGPSCDGREKAGPYP